MFYRIMWTVSAANETKTRTYIASLEDAWELWHWLTNMATMEPKYHSKLVEQKRESSIFAPFYKPPVNTVKVYELEGSEVSPDEGLAGMHHQKGA